VTKEYKGGDLFIVDNSISGWTGLRYLREWTEIASGFDIATGYFEIGSLLALDGNWQKLDKIRVLMGDEASRRTRAALLEAVKTRAERLLDGSIEDDKEKNPFLKGVPAIVDSLKSGKIECRVFNRDKFHAKAYITHAKMDVVGAQALVGSSNFTRPGLTENVELNIQVQSGREVAQLQEWFDNHWEEAKDVTEDVLKVISRHTYLFNPFDIYAKALHEFFRGHEMTAGEWEESNSKLFPHLGRYQKEAYWALMKIARQHGGAFLCDGVGLGKTFVGLMLIERLILREGKRVVLFAPKGAKEGVWEPHLRDWLPHIGGVGGSADFSNLAVFSHTDLNRKGDFPDRFKRISELADVIVIDEAHHFRNPGSQGDLETGEGRSRYYKLYDLLDDAVRPKTVFMLTATPINNRLSDFRHMAELFTRRDEAYFARTIGVNNLRAHFNRMERDLRRLLGEEVFDLGESIPDATEFLSDDKTFQQLVVQRSREYAKESQIRENESAAVFPDRRPPKVAEYSIRKTYGHLLDLIEKAFAKESPLFSLPIYYPLAYYKGEDETIDPLEEGRQRQVVGLIRTMFLKRFESSVCAFELSCDRLMRKLLAFLQVHSETDSEKKRLERWKQQNADILNYAIQRQFQFWEGDEVEEGEDDIIVEEIIQETFLDLDQIVTFIEETKKFEPKHDDKLKKLIRLLNSKDLIDKKVIVFTEFADTARYLYKHLVDAGLEGLAQIDSASRTNRADVIKCFSPYYNGTTSGALEEQNMNEIRILISTDVLSEGLNLQDACRMINYDIHWNPVRLMQRIGRVDRRLNPIVEERLVRDHPETATFRGKVSFWNFLPPDELNAILSLYRRVTQKTLLISRTLGIEGKKLLTPEDDFEALREFNHAYEGRKSAVEEMHLEYQSLLQENPDLAGYLNGLPGAIFSGRKRLAKGSRGVFFCFGLPALDTETGKFSEEAGTTQWYLYDTDKGDIIEEPRAIIESIISKPRTPRRCITKEQTLVEIRTKVLKHIKNTYLKRVDAPVGVKPSLKCWMELNEA
jgi:helicase-like protein/phospholipase D-like protein/type III restriction/modification enzyme restriction subunit